MYKLYLLFVDIKSNFSWIRTDDVIWLTSVIFSSVVVNLISIINSLYLYVIKWRLVVLTCIVLKH